MLIPDIRLHQPATLREASLLLGKFGDGARILAGGTDILNDLRLGRLDGVEHLVSLRQIAGLDGVEETQGGLKIGALLTLAAARRDERIRAGYPAFVDAIDDMAGCQVRNMATVGGNIAGAVPCSDLAPPFIAAGAKAVLSRGRSARTVDLKDFFLGPRRTVCNRGEIVTHLVVPRPAPRSGLSYKKFTLRSGNALAVAGVAAMVRIGGGIRIAEARVVLGAVAPIPDTARKTSAFLAGKVPSKNLFAEAGRIAATEARPISDVRGSEQYRRDLVEALTARALQQACQRARKGTRR